MNFRILGPLEVWVGAEQLRLSGPRQQKVLSALLVNVGRATPLPDFIEVVWEHTPPETAGKQIRNAVSNLRRSLHRTGATITAVGTGYRLSLPDEALDATVFERHVALARDHVEQGRLTEAALNFRNALSLWRGPVLVGLSSSALEPQIMRLTETRLAALEDCFDIRLQLGQHHALISELSEWVSAHPLRERLAYQLMLALYRSGRQADALGVYENVRLVLTDRLGIDPGPECRELRQRILTGDSTLLTPSTTDAVNRWAGAVLAVRGRQFQKTGCWAP